MMDQIGSYIDFGDCHNCNIYGCPDRKCQFHHWWSSDRDHDKLKRQEDKDNPIENYENNKRRVKIENCKVLKDDCGGHDSVEDFVPKRKKTRKVFVNEYIIQVGFYYENSPKTPHTRTETEFEEGSDDAKKVALGKYPNSWVIDWDIGDTDIETEREI